MVRSRSLERLVLASLVLLGGTVRGAAQLAPLPHRQGASGLALALRRLPSTARVLVSVAHPDDEHNGMLVRLSLGQGVRTTVFTATRGDGGQNEIGPELFEALGVLRTEELMAVHRYDAVDQLFGRAYEFGFSFSVEETLAKWGREETLGDIVRAIRMVRPDVILTLPLRAPGGGQHHQAIAQLTLEAFRAAADPTRFPNQLREGLPPWQARKLYEGGVGGSSERLAGAPPISVSTGTFDPILGMTWHEMGSLARSAHKCQGMGQLKASPGTGAGVFSLIDSEPRVADQERDILDGIDGSLGGLLGFVPQGHTARASLAAGANDIEQAIDASRRAFSMDAPWQTAPSLSAGLTAVRRLRSRVDESGLPATARYELSHRLAQKERDFLEALPFALGLVMEVAASDDRVTPGQMFDTTASVWNQGPEVLRTADLTISAPQGWTVETKERAPAEVPPGASARTVVTVRVPDDARASQPYWTRRSAVDRYDVVAGADDLRPWDPPAVVATLSYAVRGVAATLDQPAIWRYGRLLSGEKQKVVAVVSALSVRVSPDVAIVPAGRAGARTEIRVRVRNEGKNAEPATVRIEAPAGWQVEPAEAALAFRAEGEEVASRFELLAPPQLPAGEYRLRAVAVRKGREYREGYQEIAYDHVQERLLYRPAAARVVALDVSVSENARVGYVMGAGDEVASAIRQLGVPVELLDEDDLAFADLSRYTTIVTGIRAYQTRADLRTYHQRVMDYVLKGGHLVVQYNKFEFNSRGTGAPAGDSPFAPYPAAVSSNRVSVEEAPVRILRADASVLRSPNRIVEADFQGWVQERGLYFLDARDSRYEELLSSADPWPNNPGEKKGLLTEASVGKGTWTYVGLGLFRQLPAGVPGAYRLLANLVSRARAR
jgi:LmbE family N-acetylglucosaminyl deacetylase